ncbi:glycosyltransferase family 2 protein [Capnocytophaga canis]|uniref:glycosyltransferase family 2 protein n=1 Tax=Capnocytophaga canis TaxID=1848903 RepID=UPI00156247DF|nr:glycosyltransferase family 2 protein [Capnocytophaga canis]
MECSPLISIVTVSFNALKTIEQTILSVVNQTYPNIEYIIIDGGSTDGTVDIIKKYEDKIAYWVSEPDKGIYDAMNKGIEKASGEWINFMNSGDEFYNENVLRDVFLKENLKEVDVLYGDVVVKLPKKEVLKKATPLQNIEKWMVFCHQSTFVRTKLHRENFFNITYKICADYDFFLKLYRKRKKFRYLSKVISKFLHGGVSDSLMKVSVESWHISGMKNSKRFLFVIAKEFFLGRFIRFYSKWI